jgi:formylglycine-generating enzyme required for sulfatase activity
MGALSCAKRVEPQEAVGPQEAVEPQLVRVEGGTFPMGSDNGESEEKPAHTVTVQSFSIGKYEVTQREYQEVMGTKAPNSLGLYDMSGNVWEWCWDWYGNYASGPQTGPRGASSGSFRVLRGGCWLNSAQDVRSAHRAYGAPFFPNHRLGFRLVRNG